MLEQDHSAQSGRRLPNREIQSVGNRAVSDPRKDGTFVQSSYNQ